MTVNSYLFVARGRAGFLMELGALVAFFFLFSPRKKSVILGVFNVRLGVRSFSIGKDSSSDCSSSWTSARSFLQIKC